MTHHYAFSAAVAAFALVAASSTFANDDTLEKAIRNVRGQTGGTLVSIHPNAGGRQFEAVLIDPNGVVKTALYRTAGQTVESVGPATREEARPDAKAIRGATVSLSKAVETAEEMTGEEAVAAEFFSDPGADLLAYRVTMANGSDQAVFVDARSGEELPSGSVHF